MANFGVHVDIPATIQMAGNATSGTDVTPWYTIDLNQTQTALVGLSEQINVAAVPGNPPQMGRVMEVPVMLNRLYQNLTAELADGVFELSMIDVAPTEPEKTTTYTGQTTVHVVEQGQELGLIARLYGVDMQDIIDLNDITDPNLLYVGQELTIPAAGEYEPSAADAPAAPTSTGKSIVVSTGQQRIFAYENGQLVHSHLVSTGLPDTPTVLGDYKVYVKYTATDMSGPGYYLPSVPYTMYFYQGYGIHGTYWHNAFGRPMSHGCVNLPTPEAEWFFNWAEVGTPVRVV
jgi:lipoprotein-anchoring transpeptidase ErfK/SrfK